MTSQPGTEQDERPGIRCSFCRKHQDDVLQIVAGPGVFICNECVEACVEILEEHRTSK